MFALRHGWGFEVRYDEDDCAAFNATWPTSKVHGKGALMFHREGDLFDCYGSAVGAREGEDWTAFVANCERFGRTRLGLGLPKPQLGRNPSGRSEP
jgi:hypothetical protein